MLEAKKFTLPDIFKQIIDKIENLNEELKESILAEIVSEKK